jgi:hypothetical protein
VEEALLRLYYLLRLYEGSIKAVLSVSMKAL